ncbi:hypothetical protein I4U23_027026 [Adineta vaga]|nr:hypothetical protein I4U23_027026 [Adineta vaga]
MNSQMNISQYPSSKSKLAIVGWEITKDNRTYLSNIFQQLEISMIDINDSFCSNFNIDSNKQFCAGFNHQIIGGAGGSVFQWMNGYWD